MRHGNLLLMLLALTLVTTGCMAGTSPPAMPEPEPAPTNPAPLPESASNSDIIAGEVCIVERVHPKEIHMNERFLVQVIVEAKQHVQSVYLIEDGWFREFRLIQEPRELWLEFQPGERRAFYYEVELWSQPPESHLQMFGSVSCNVGGLGESEILKLESKLNVVHD